MQVVRTFIAFGSESQANSLIGMIGVAAPKPVVVAGRPVANFQSSIVSWDTQDPKWRSGNECVADFQHFAMPCGYWISRNARNAPWNHLHQGGTNTGSHDTSQWRRKTMWGSNLDFFGSRHFWNSALKSWRLPPRIKPIWEIVAISAAQKQLGKPNFSCQVLWLPHVLETLDASKDCTVGDWSAWDLCSVSCGTGTTTRKRSVTKQQALWLELLNSLYLLQVVNPLRLYCMSLLADLSLTRHLVVLHVRISPRHIPAIQVTFAPRPILDLCASMCFSYSNIFQLLANHFVVHCPKYSKAVAPLKWDDQVYLLLLLTVLESWSTFS